MRIRACLATGDRRRTTATATTAAAATAAAATTSATSASAASTAATAVTSTSAVTDWQDRASRFVGASDETSPEVDAVRVSEEASDGDRAAGRLHACLTGRDREGQPTLTQVAGAPIQGPRSPIRRAVRAGRRLGARARRGR